MFTPCNMPNRKPAKPWTTLSTDPVTVKPEVTQSMDNAKRRRARRNGWDR